MDFEVPTAAMEELLRSFLADAVGLTLEAQIDAARDLPPTHRACTADSTGQPRVWAAWQSNRGMVSAAVLCHREQSHRLGAHVLFISWWIGPQEHHEGWWHCYPKRPHEWIKGAGSREPPLAPA
jgi:hypothetical protein